jgi:uncharacterized SAM-binding protein YcdF (DUF218 family)
MFLMRKILTPFLLPPGLLVAVLIVAGLYFAATGRRKTGWFNVFLGALAWAAATTPVADRVHLRLEAGLSIPAPMPSADVIVLLGGSVYAGAPDITGLGTPSEEALVRIVTAARLQRQTRLPLIVSGGPVFPDSPPIAPVYRRFLMDLGVPAGSILLEERSRDTLENARFSRELCRRQGFRRALVVTSAAHMPRALWCFARAGLPATAVPCGFRTWPGMTYSWRDALPRSYDRLAEALYEHMGLLFYRMSG